MSEQELWEWACPELGWKRLDPEERGYAGEVVETYLVCVKSETEFNLSDSQDPVAYVDQPRDVVCGLIPDLRGYADWEASAVWINVCIPKRPVWVHLVVVILKALGRILIIEIKLTHDEAAAFDQALRQSA